MSIGQDYEGTIPKKIETYHHGELIMNSNIYLPLPYAELIAQAIAEKC